MQRTALLFLLCSATAVLAENAEPPRGSLTIERIAAIRLPSDASWSPDGGRIAFLWDAAGDQNLFIVRPGEAPRALSDFPPNPDDLTADIDGFDWLSPTEIVLLHDGVLHRASTEGGLMPLSGFHDVRQFALSPKKDALALIRDNGTISVVDGSGHGARDILHTGSTLSSPVLSPDGEHVAFVASHTERVADLLGYNGPKMGLYRNEIDDWRVGLVSISGGEPVWISVEGRPSYLQWTGNDRLLFQRVSFDMKTRELLVASLDGTTRTLRRDHDDRWWSPIGRDARTAVSPDGTLVAFIADETGFSQLYVQPTDPDRASEVRQLTQGEYEVGFGSWSPDGTRIAYYDNEASPMERFVRVVEVATGEIRPVVLERGVNYWPRFSPDGKRLVFERTDVHNSVDLYVSDVEGSGPMTRLTSSMSPEIDEADLTVPVPVSFPSRVDGKSVPASLFVPAKLDRSRMNPAIVWIHGSGSDQNFLGWHPFSYRMYYSANQYLAQQGYVILAVDYRGSTGYGREWGTGHYLDLGGPDTLDVASGADYLKTLDYVDPDRIGVWGLSYGGFLTLQVLTRTPTLFRCGIDVAGVSSWATWGLESNGGWITGRMSTPRANPEGYIRTAPIKHMETLERPLLILHGTADVNVAFRESLNLIDVLLKMGKDFDFEVYPGELHFFRREHILRDAWRRAERFFDANLREGPILESQ